MKKPLLSLVIAFSAFLTVRGQQDPQFTQFFYNKLIMNPAYAGAKDAICVTLLNRNQWVGYKGAPTSTLISADMPVWKSGDNQIAAGVTAYMDYIGYEKNYSLRFAGTYRRTNLGPGALAVGFDLGFSNKGIEAPVWNYPSPNGQGDPNIPAPGSAQNDFGLDLGLGVYYHTDNWYAGVSCLHLAGWDYKSINIRQARNLYFMGGYTFSFNHPDWQLNPNILVKTDFSTAQLDVNANVIWKEYYWAGLTYRIQDAVAINIGLSMGAFSQSPFLRGLQVSYSYDINTSRLNSFNSGTHEIVLRYCFKLEKPVELYRRYNVRFLDSNKDRY